MRYWQSWVDKKVDTAMPRIATPLSDVSIKSAIRKAEKRSAIGRNFPLWDGQGLHLLNRGGRYAWRLKYTRPDGRDNRLALGMYPIVSLTEARARAEDARRQLRNGIDPGAARKALKAENRRKVTDTFERHARKWAAAKAPGWSKSTRDKIELVLRDYLIPAIGNRDVRDLGSMDIVKVLRRIHENAPSLVKKAAQATQATIRVAIQAGAREEGRLLDLNLRDNLPKVQKRHYSAATTPDDVKAVMGGIRKLTGEITRAALLVCAYTAQRPGNVAAMRWCDVDTKASEWNIPAEVMKTGQPHTVPLSRQALALIKSMRPYSGGTEYVFPPVSKQKTPHLHRDSLSKALRDAGLKGKQTPHGLRATLRTVARERLGISADVLEAQLAHAKKGEVQSAYDRTGFVQERHRLAQTWADYLDGTERNTVTPIRRKAG